MEFKCPICSLPVAPPVPGQEGYFPFCSERCKMVDLGAWFDGDYKVQSDQSQDENDDGNM